MAYLAAAARLLERPRYFFLFTKRMVLDYDTPFLDLAGDVCNGALCVELLRECLAFLLPMLRPMLIVDYQ